jgi:signal transduction histidine kinase
VLRTGKSIHTPVVTDEMLRAGARDYEHFAVLKELNLRSALIVPLTARGVILGSLTLINSDSQRDLVDEDVALAEELGRRAGAAVDAARLLHESQEAIRVRDEFTAMASHDMRTPLAAVRGYAQLVRRQLSGPNPDLASVQRWLTDIEVGSDRLARLVGEFTDASLLRGGQTVPLQPVATDLVRLAAEWVADHQGGASDAHRLELVAETESLVGQWDGVRLGRVLDNLIGNAVKFSPDGGRIEVRVRTEDGRAVIAISDEGIGIPASEMALIFAPSYRARNAENVFGTGLGLSGSQRLVEQMGGAIEVSSRIGQGSCFTIRLPLG